jgi:hypothetical protein
MTRMAFIAAAAAIASFAAFGLAGSGGIGPNVPGPDLSIRVPVTRPSSPYTWPQYPKFPHSACWGTRRPRFAFARSAPSFRPRAPEHPPAPAELETDRLTRIYAPLPSRSNAMLAHWEVQLIGGALRDDLCDAGDQPLIGWGTGSSDGSFAARGAPFGQRFPNPSPREFRTRVDLIGRRYGFRVVSLRLLRPRQIAPLLVVRTSRDRRDFVRDVWAIMALLNPGGAAGSETFEGLFFEALDARGPFVRTYRLARGQTGGDWWSAVDIDPCGLHSMPPSVAEACSRRS